jgi:recombinational DNA repair protein (RecF pathway)
MNEKQNTETANAQDGCALCDRQDKDGGILWDDSRFLCARCWSEAADQFHRASEAALLASKRTIDRREHPF